MRFIVVLAYIRYLSGALDVHGIPVFVFMIYGSLFIQLFMTVTEKTASCLGKYRALFAFRQVQPISAYIATAAFEILIKIIVATVIVFLMFYAI